MRGVAEAVGLSRMTISRTWHAFAFKPHRTETFKLSPNSLLIEKARNIVGLYLNPPDHALVFCMDEESQTQALDRTQALLLMGLGYVESMAHDYRRHSTTTLFAARNTATGQALSQCRRRHRLQKSLDILCETRRNVPQKPDVHVIVDNYATQKHPRVKRWLKVRLRFHIQLTPTYASRLNQVGIWFNRITQQAIRRGAFQSVRELVAKIDQFVCFSNAHA